MSRRTVKTMPPSPSVPVCVAEMPFRSQSCDAQIFAHCRAPSGTGEKALAPEISLKRLNFFAGLQPRIAVVATGCQTARMNQATDLGAGSARPTAGKDEAVIAEHLIARYGLLLGRQALTEVLQFPSADAFDRHVQRGHLEELVTARFPGRRGVYALATEVARYLIKHSGPGTKQS